MKFVDEAEIEVRAGRGGDGCLSFRREKFIPRGGPDGGDGGRGGDVYLVGAANLNTLADFRYTRRFQAQNGAPGAGRQRSGRSGADLEIPVPPGTLVRDAATGEQIGDITAAGQRLLVARGGRGGFGNLHFKSSTHRAPRRTTPGRAGESRRLQLELRLLADVGLLGLPNAGKSTLLRAVSQARPKVADYPFTTLHPALGVVEAGPARSFVMADIPGLIEGAAEGAGLGLRFLRHLSRTRLILHLVDIAPPEARDLVRDVQAIAAELARFSPRSAATERWLVLNKIDLLDPDGRAERRRRLLAGLDWRGPVFEVSAATGEGCRALVQAIMQRLEGGPVAAGSAGG